MTLPLRKSEEHLPEVLKALGEPQRIAILRLVLERKLPAGEIADHFKTTRAGGLSASEAPDQCRPARITPRRHQATLSRPQGGVRRASHIPGGILGRSPIDAETQGRDR